MTMKQAVKGVFAASTQLSTTFPRCKLNVPKPQVGNHVNICESYAILWVCRGYTLEDEDDTSVFPIQSYTSIGCIDYRLRLRCLNGFSTGDIDIVVKETLGGASEQTVGEGLSSKPWKGKPHLTHIKITSPSFTSASLWKL